MMYKTAAALFLGLTLALPVSAQSEGQPEPLSPQDLSRCSQQIQTLRDESKRLLAASEAADKKRNAINARTAELANARAEPGDAELESGLSLAQARIEHQSMVVLFNKEVEALRGEITAVNALKFDYEQRCAGRPYRRADLEKLDAEAQAAMRSGLNNVKVPYLDPNAPPIPGTN